MSPLSQRLADAASALVEAGVGVDDLDSLVPVMDTLGLSKGDLRPALAGALGDLAAAALVDEAADNEEVSSRFFRLRTLVAWLTG